MPTYSWTGLGVADGTTMDSTNVNATGNGDTIQFQATSGTSPVRVFRRNSTHGNGIEISGAATSLVRLDTPIITGGSACMAVQEVIVPSGPPTTDINGLFVGRNANATPTFSGYVQHKTTGELEFRHATNAVVSSSVSGSATSGLTPALVNNHAYQVDFAIIGNTTTTRTTSNGRILGRVRSLTAPGTWNGGAEYWLDTGYTTNVTLDNTNLFRMDKTNTACVLPTLQVLNRMWRDHNTPNTSLTKSDAITNFVQVSGPTITTTGTGEAYLMVSTATSGTVTYSWTQIDGNPQTPVYLGNGVYKVTQDPDGPLEYTITVTDTGGGGSTSTNFVVPQATEAAGVFGRARRSGGIWVV